MQELLIWVLLMGMSLLTAAQTPPATPTSVSVIAVIEDVTAKHFLPDTAFSSLSEEDEVVLVKEPIANWGLPQESGKAMTYYNLVVGTRSYQLVIVKMPKAEFPTATLLRFTTPKSKPEPIARGAYSGREKRSRSDLHNQGVSRKQASV